MRTDWSHLERARKTDGDFGTAVGDKFGVFYFTRGTTQIIAIASSGNEEIAWEHVSARARDFKGERTPTWAEMCWLKDQFWGDEERVVQFHPPKSEYVNNHPFVLHLFKPIGVEMPFPPSETVGIR